MVGKSIKEQRIRKITQLYYSNKSVQKAIFDFSKNREIVPMYFEGFGKRPDSFQYQGDVFGLVKKGATSFHCSEEIWEDPLKIDVDLKEYQTNNLRTGWDLLIDIDCKWFDYAKLAAKAIIETFKRHGIKNLGIKFSGSKGFHILVPWKAFPKEINGVKTSDLFPEVPRKIVAYLRYYSGNVMKELVPEDFEKQFEKTKIKKGFKCKKCGEVANTYDQIELYCKFCRIGEIRKFERGAPKQKYFCAECKKELEGKDHKEISECRKCELNSINDSNEFTEVVEMDLYDLMGLDLILVSPRHLFRTPYSLHEKTALASVVLEEKEVEDFELKDADPMKVKIRDFMPNSFENEAAELVMQALDWAKQNKIGEERQESATGKYANFKPIKLKELKEDFFPPCIKKILTGLADGKKRALFAMINLFRSVGMEKEELEKRLYEWNEKNEIPLKKAYIKTQLIWSYRRKPILSPNCKEFYQGLGVCSPDNICRAIKNPVNYVVRKDFLGRGDRKTKSSKHLKN